MKIIAIGWNYLDHNKEMDRTLLPKEPVVFLKPETALLKDGKPFFLPDFSNRIEYETEIVVHICRLGKNIASKFAHRYYDEVTVGIDFTARDLQSQLRKEGAPWEISKGFDSSAVIGKFIPLAQAGDNIRNIPFSLLLNGDKVQEGNSSDMLFSIDDIIAYVSRFYTLKIGDLIYTGTPSGVRPVKINDHLQGYIGDKKLLDFYVK
ncbi:fumarylacetoacetate hydrolase family protein [Coprobacter tertius]|uniref:Fumarylacetoacetate hydrolase family protein n=1 Tax=Coprobacter tertius TaxID=2944915 RepID=A0ABT1MEJ2_9BACT|nr:fumarylacetoacetate hydrolase family protein [Coprobacter tertius]MCP9610784.1 fumarylacetoacetate hydrolase family protein [Coprobacter tertius]